jgi:hypothetical protein
MKQKTLKVLNFSEFPGLRHISISDNSGEEFYHTVLNEEFYNSILKEQKLILNLDGVAGYAPSFLDEAIGNLVYDFSLTKVNKFFDIISDDEESWKDMIKNETYPDWEQRRLKSKSPKKTKNHQPWYRLVKDEFQKNVWIKKTES